MRSDLKKLDSFTLEMSKNHLIRSFLRNGRLRVKVLGQDSGVLEDLSSLFELFRVHFVTRLAVDKNSDSTILNYLIF